MCCAPSQPLSAERASGDVPGSPAVGTLDVPPEIAVLRAYVARFRSASNDNTVVLMVPEGETHVSAVLDVYEALAAREDVLRRALQRILAATDVSCSRMDSCAQCLAGAALAAVYGDRAQSTSAVVATEASGLPANPRGGRPAEWSFRITLAVRLFMAHLLSRGSASTFDYDGPTPSVATLAKMHREGLFTKRRFNVRRDRCGGAVGTADFAITSRGVAFATAYPPPAGLRTTDSMGESC